MAATPVNGPAGDRQMRLKHLRRHVMDPVIGLGLHALALALGCLPHAWLVRLARFTTPFAALCVPEAKRLIAANLHLAFPDWAADKVAQTGREALTNAILLALEFIWFLRQPGKLPELIDTPAEAADKLAQLQTSQTGTILVTPHIGNWEFMGQAVAALSDDLYAVAQSRRNPWLESMILRARQANGLHVIYDRGAARQMLSVLRAGGVLGVLMDQNTRPAEGGVFVDFFGLPVAVTRAPAALARRMACKVLVVACVRNVKRGRFTLAVLELPKPAAAYESDEEMTQALVAANEELIRKYPTQYAWLYRRWRYVPDSAPTQVRERYPYYARPYTAVERRTHDGG